MVDTSNLVIATANVAGWTRKRNVILNLIDSDQIEILAITETKCSEGYNIKISKFRTFQQFSHRPGLAARGTALLIRDTLATTPLTLPPQFDHLECCAAILHLPRSQITLITLYNYPNEPFPQDVLQYACTLNKAIILGDFNARHTLFGDSLINRNGRILHNCLTELPLFRLHNENPTFLNFNGSSIVDHILVTENLIRHFPDSCYIGTTVTSDHLPHLPHLVQSTLCNKPPAMPLTKTIHDYKNTEWTNFANHVDTNIDRHPALNTTHKRHHRQTNRRDTECRGHACAQKDY